jgi:hypothetical protein
MIITKENANNTLDVRIILAMLWVAGMLASLNGDTYRLSDSAVLESLLAKTGPIVASGGLLLFMSLIFVGSVFMSVLTVALAYPVSRWANRIVGILYAVANLGNWGASFVVQPTGYGIVWSTAGVVFALLVVWYAWKWPKQEA